MWQVQVADVVGDQVAAVCCGLGAAPGASAGSLFPQLLRGDHKLSAVSSQNTFPLERLRVESAVRI